MDIGTAKPSEEELSTVKHHFINSLDRNEDYDVADYERDALVQLDAIFKTSDHAVMVGGSGLVYSSGALWTKSHASRS